MSSASFASPSKGADKNALANKILHEVYALYTKPSTVKRELGSAGLEAISQEAGLTPPLLHPRRRVTVMLIGNHSAGKSSFVNWYCDEPIQGTGVAVESQGFTICRSGTDVQDIKGEGALVDNDHVAAVVGRLPPADRKRFVDHLTMLVRTSTARDFPRIDLIDTPGLVDGHVVYPFDVNRVIVELASIADLIIVMLDPIGQALCSRTMNVVKELNDKGHYDKMRYYLTKADTVARREDLNKVIVQVTQNLSLRVANTHGFDVPCMWLPSEASALVPHPSGGSGTGDAYGGEHRTVAGEVNSLGRLCNDISKTIATKVQANMTSCAEDCKRLLGHIDAELEREAAGAAVKAKWRRYTWALRPWLAVLGLLSFLDVLTSVQGRLPSSLTTAPLAVSLLGHAGPVMDAVREGARLAGFATLQQRLTALAGAFAFVAVLLQFLACRSRGLRTRSRPALLALGERQAAVELMRVKVGQLYQEYVRAAQTPEYNFAAVGAAAAATSGGSAKKGGGAATPSAPSDAAGR